MSHKHHSRIPNRLRRFRKIAGLTQIEVAEKLGLKCTDCVSKWEKGRSMPNSKNLLRLALLYQVLPHQLYIDYLPILSEELGLANENISSKEYLNFDEEFS